MPTAFPVDPALHAHPPGILPTLRDRDPPARLRSAFLYLHPTVVQWLVPVGHLPSATNPRSSLTEGSDPLTYIMTYALC